MIAAIKWPTWQQSGAVALALVVVWMIVRRLRPTRATEVALPALHELIVITSLYAVWRSAKKLPLTQSDGAVERARSIVDLQEALFIPSELVFQDFLLRHDWLGWLSSAYYAVMHVPALIAFLIWLFWRHRGEYSRWRNVLAIVTAGCLFIRFVRVAPPRFLPDLGFIDLAAHHGFDVYGPAGTGVSPQFAAMPSIHVAWAAIVAFGVVVASTSPWRWVVFLHFPITFFVVAATGHHWWMDGFVAVGLIAAAVVIDAAGRRLLQQVRDRREQVVVLRESAELGELSDDVVG